MYAENEYGVRKLVCSTVRPTQLPFPELYDMHGCASFLAGYIIYEPLEPPTEPPKVLFSPTETLNSHTGDSFDIAMVLCSFLLGAGFDAYVVYGNSPKFVTMRDQRATECPLIGQATTVGAGAAAQQRHGHVAHASEENDEKVIEVAPYKVLDNSVKNSVFVAEQAELKRTSGNDAFQLWISNADEKSRAPATDNDGIRRCHAFVLVRAGKREVREHVFLEPATGRPYSSTTVPLSNIAAAWNHNNYWVNLQINSKTADMTFDLQDGKNWEYLFIGETAKASPAETNAEDLDMNGETEEKGEGDSPAGYEVSRSFDAPPTWVNPLSMDRPRYALRFPPTGKRCVQYHCAKASFYSRGVNPQSMTMSIVQYLDVECTIVKEIHEWFEIRTDHLYKRVRYALNPNVNVEHYHPGSLGGVKTWTEMPGKSIDIEFYMDSRLDRLYRRTEIIGKEITEYFSGRTDCLIYRSFEVTTDKAIAGARQFAMSGGSLAPQLFVLKMVQKFELPADGSKAPAPNTDVATRIFSVREGKLITYFQFDQGKIIGKVRTYLHTRGPSIPVMSEQALQQELGLEEDPDELQDAASIERECFAAIKGSMQQMEKVIEHRVAVEMDVKVGRSVFDKALDACYGMDAGANSKEKAPAATAAAESAELAMTATISSVAGDTVTAASDYLTPFLRGIKDINAITKEEALEVRQICLDACKARLVERANIIQARLNDENARLGRKQEQFQRSQREGDLSTAEYEKYCTEAMFRIQILEQRLVTHEETALKKFLDLDVKLGIDPRLRVLKSSDR